MENIKHKGDAKGRGRSREMGNQLEGGTRRENRNEQEGSVEIAWLGEDFK